MSDLATILQNLAGYVPTFLDLVGAIAFLCGCTLVVLAIYRMAQRSNSVSSQRTYAGALANLLAGCFLIALPSTIGMLNTSLWGTPETASADSIFAYAPTLFEDHDSAARLLIVAMVRIIQLLGVIAIFRGILLLNDHVQGQMGQSKLGAGLTFIISGGLAVNFSKFVGLIEGLV